MIESGGSFKWSGTLFARVVIAAEFSPAAEWCVIFGGLIKWRLKKRESSAALSSWPKLPVSSYYLRFLQLLL